MHRISSVSCILIISGIKNIVFQRNSYNFILYRYVLRWKGTLEILLKRYGLESWPNKDQHLLKKNNIPYFFG